MVGLVQSFKNTLNADELAAQAKEFQTLHRIVSDYAISEGAAAADMQDPAKFRTYLMDAIEAKSKLPHTERQLEQAQGAVANLEERIMNFGMTVSGHQFDNVDQSLRYVTRAVDIGRDEANKQLTFEDRTSEYNKPAGDMMYNCDLQFVEAAKQLGRPHEMTKVKDLADIPAVPSDLLLESKRQLEQIAAYINNEQHKDLPETDRDARKAEYTATMQRNINHLDTTLVYSPQEGVVALSRLNAAVPFVEYAIAQEIPGAADLKDKMYKLGQDIVAHAIAPSVDGMQDLVDGLLDCRDERRSAFATREKNKNPFDTFVARADGVWGTVAQRLPGIDLSAQLTQYNELKNIYMQHIPKKE